MTNLQSARETGRRAADMAEAAAERDGFDGHAAREFMWRFLKSNGPASGEQLTRALIDAGMAPREKRALGPSFRKMVTDGWIEVLRSDLPRVSGNGTAGGRLYGALL